MYLFIFYRINSCATLKIVLISIIFCFFFEQVEMTNPFPNVENTSIDPYRAICRFEVRRNKIFNSPTNRSTGFLIGKRHILTAAHNYAKYGWWRAGSYVVGATARFGAHGGYEVLDVQNFYQNMNFRYSNNYGRNKFDLDYCLITLKSDVEGIAPFKLIEDDDEGFKERELVYSAGYSEGSAYMREDNGEITNIGKHIVSYNMDTEPGLSGGPVWIKGEDGLPRIVGVHVRGNGPRGGAKIITARVREQLLDWGWQA